MAKAYGITYHILKSRLKYRKDGEELVPLRLSIAYGLGSTVAPELEGRLVSSLEEGGIELEVYAIPAEALLKEYYRLDEKKSRLETSRLSKEPYFQWINRDC